MLNRDSERFQFFRAWLAEPLRVAAIAPSGRALSALIVSEVSAQTGPVIELGPATGAFTRGLLTQGVAEENLTLVEYGQEFVVKLATDFPRARILHMDAARLRDVVLPNETKAGAVISGLPLLSMSPRKVYEILSGAFAHLRPDGVFYQFTYGPRCPITRPMLDRLELKATYVGGTFANLPPAAVYRIRRRKPRRIQDA
jgi:phosphatidylethanolamine/phosphatidyl-N-methylethanolamine N-methyltransferase